MTSDATIKDFAQDPGRLIDLIRQVIDQLVIGRNEATPKEQEAQLREIAKTIERLQKSEVSVPDALRSEKTRLIASIELHEDRVRALAELATGLQATLNDLRYRTNEGTESMPGRPTSGLPDKRSRSREPESASTPTRHRSKEPTTDFAILRQQIIIALRAHGGSARSQVVIDEMAKQLEGHLLPRDLELRDTAGIVWRHNTHWERWRMVQDGILKKGSPKGVWELSEQT
ncbi:MAG: hypothetical protein KGJ62_05630 [Armatimonadetes bacterium]|nr:hypothetical protein [Armatimonadota bacterium]